MKVNQPLADRYLSAILTGDSEAAGSAVDRALEAGWTLQRLCLGMFETAQRRVGDLWEEGEVGVAEEHRATQITLREIARLRRLTSPDTDVGRRSVVAAVEGERHSLGAAIVALFLTADGWTVDYLGGDVPADEIVRFVGSETPHLIALSVTMTEHLDAMRVSVSRLRELSERPALIAGGQAFESDAAAAFVREVNEQTPVVVSTGRDATQAARELVGLPPRIRSLEDCLYVLGSRVREARRRRDWSQSRLADATGLARPYVSALENGKRNVSLGVLVKLANALDTTPDSLLR